jgi:hypothetical protein
VLRGGSVASKHRVITKLGIAIRLYRAPARTRWPLMNGPPVAIQRTRYLHLLQDEVIMRSFQEDIQGSRSSKSQIFENPRRSFGPVKII